VGSTAFLLAAASANGVGVPQTLRAGHRLPGPVRARTEPREPSFCVLTFRPTVVIKTEPLPPVSRLLWHHLV